MEQTDGETPTGVIARRVREVRKRRGLTAEQVAERLNAQGVNWQRSTLAKLENGKRENVSVVEWLALATVLNVAPVHLLLPIDEQEGAPYWVTPAKAVPVADARGWIRGSLSLGNGPTRDFRAEAPEGEWVSFDVTTREGQQAAIEWAKRSGWGTVTRTGENDGPSVD